MIVGLMRSHPLAGMPQSEITLDFPLAFRGCHALLVKFGLQKPVPMSALLLHPLAVSGWFGMFATALNLLPGGQLDGGHMVFAFSERLHRIVSWLTVLALVPMAWYCWPGWLIWAAVLGVSGLRHPTVYSWDGLGWKRWLLMAVGATMLAVCIAPRALIETNDDFRKSVTEAIHYALQWARIHLLRG
jgi:hypothetical protein